VTELLIAMAPQGGDAGGGGGFMTTMVMFALIFVIFYFMILRPQQKRTKAREKMLGELKKGDKVVTSGGLHGKIINVDEKTILVEVDDNVKLTFERSAVSAIPSQEK
jgi:preprotein translocase subunit YajC